jgi:transcriptional regulator with XRE-family HTH domain
MKLPDTKGMSYGTRLSVLMALKDPAPKRKEIAGAAEISVQAVGDLIRGQTKQPSAEVNQRLAEFFGVTPEYMLKGEDALRPPAQTLQPSLLVSENHFLPAHVGHQAELDFINALPPELQRYANVEVPLRSPHKYRTVRADYYSGKLWVEVSHSQSGRASPIVGDMVLDMIRFQHKVDAPVFQAHIIFITPTPVIRLSGSLDDACTTWGIKTHTVKTPKEAAELVAYLEAQDPFAD